MYIVVCSANTQGRNLSGHPLVPCRVRRGVAKWMSNISKYLKRKTSQSSKVLLKTIWDFSAMNAQFFWKQVILDRKVLKMQRYSSVTLHVSPKNPISAEKKKITFSKIHILARNFFPQWFGPKQIEAIHFQNKFHDNSAQTDCSKEIWIPILKGLNNLNTVLNQSIEQKIKNLAMEKV